MRAKKVFLNSMGIINALGDNKALVLNNLLQGDQAGLVLRNDLVPGKDTYVGQVTSELPSVTDTTSIHNSRNNRLLLAAYEQIAVDVECLKKNYGADRIGIVLGSSTSGIAEGEQALAVKHNTGCFPERFDYKMQELSAPAEFLQKCVQTENIAYTVSTACSSSAKIFASATQLIQADICDAVLVGGVDSLCQLTCQGFSALESVSDQISNPFSKNRNGINIGEGAGLFILSKTPGPIELLGVGESSDAYHISSPDPEGNGAEMAIRRALEDAGLQSGDIDYINIHGTATKKNDAMESKAIHRLFGEKVFCSSTKPLIGHCLGAAGALEVGLCWLLLSEYNQQLKIPRQIWDGIMDDTLEPIGLITRSTHFTKKNNICASTSFAFGGSNACVIIGNSL